MARYAPPREAASGKGACACRILGARRGPRWGPVRPQRADGSLRRDSTPQFAVGPAVRRPGDRRRHRRRMRRARCARDAGSRVALVDRGDFGSGISWNSLKIVHGGLAIAAGARHPPGARVRARAARVAPHRAASRRAALRSWCRRAAPAANRRCVMRAGLALNDIVCARSQRGSIGVATDCRRPRSLARRAAMRSCPACSMTIPAARLFHDAQLYSAERLVRVGARGCRARGRDERELRGGGRAAARERLARGRGGGGPPDRRVASMCAHQ